MQIRNKQKGNHNFNFLSKKTVWLFMALLLLASNLLVAFSLDQSKELSLLESKLLGLTYPKDSETNRLNRLEETAFGKTSSESPDKRIAKLKKLLNVPKLAVPDSFFKEQEIAETSAPSAASSKETKIADTKTEVIPQQKNIESLSKLMLEVINQERSLRSLRPLELDPTASKISLAHASYLIHSRQFSHYGQNGSNPDQRYTEAGGEGKVIELVDGYFASVDEKGAIIPIEADKETPHNLMDALLKVPDKSDMVFDALSNGVGISFVLAPDKRQLVVVIELVSNYASVAKIPPKVRLYENVGLSGSLSGGFKFAWVGIAKKEIEKGERSETEASPYFPPIDQVIYVDRSGDRAKNIAKTGGIILAMVAAPFTYGASMLVANVLMQTIAQTYQAQDVEMREGVRSDGNSFNGSVTLGEWGPGIYYVTVWAITNRDKKPQVVSRRAVLVT